MTALTRAWWPSTARPQPAPAPQGCCPTGTGIPAAPYGGLAWEPHYGPHQCGNAECFGWRGRVAGGAAVPLAREDSE